MGLFVRVSWIFGFISIFPLTHPLFADSSAHSSYSCDQFLIDLQKYQNALTPQYFELPLRSGQKLMIPIYDTELALLLQEGFSAQMLEQAERLLKSSGTYDIPVKENGAVVAAPTSGGYGKAIWIRDLARVFEGLVSLGRREEAKKVARAILKAMTTADQTHRLHENIRYPHLHFSPNGQMMVLHIRMNAEDFSSFHEGWNHKQNDALALSFLAVLQAFREGLLTPQDLEPVERQYLAALPTYFERLMYWEMHDGGAWEEWNGVRVSSLMLVTKVFEELIKMRQASSKESFAQMLEAEVISPLFPDDVLQYIQQTHKLEKLKTIYNYGMKRIHDFLERGESPDSDHGHRARFEDAALAHIFWYPLDEFSEHDYRLILKHLEALQRDSGVIRYHDDMYLHTLYYFGRENSDAQIPIDFLASNRELRAHELWKIFHPRQPDRADPLFGQGLEPQWSIHNSVIAYGALFLYERFKKPEYLALAEEHTLRSLAQVTGTQVLPSLDGTPTPIRKVPEARSPLYLHIRKNGEIVERIKLMVLSNNSPLYWATAEQAVLLKRWRSSLASSKAENP